MSNSLKRLSIIALLGFPLAVVLFRLNVINFSTAFLVLGASLVLALLVFFVAQFLVLKHRKSNPESAKQARWAVYLCLIPILGLGTQILSSKKVPMIHNISTDTQNPPQFDAIKSLRGDSSNPLAYNSEQLATVQQTAYPDVKTLISSDTSKVALEKALAIAKQLGWEIVNQDEAAGRIEATDTTMLWGFKDDIVIRITTNDNQTMIDLRSVSRIGKSDLGKNAARIREFIKTYNSKK